MKWQRRDHKLTKRRQRMPKHGNFAPILNAIKRAVTKGKRTINKGKT